VIERINRQRRGPMAAVLRVVGLGVQRMHPRGHGAGLVGARIPARYFVGIARCPNDVGVGRIGQRKAGFASAYTVVPTGIATSHGYAGAAHRPIVLHVAIYVVGDLVIHGNVIHLPDGQLHIVEALAAVRGNVDAAIIGEGEAVGVFWVPPDVVVVAAPAGLFKCVPAVD